MEMSANPWPMMSQSQRDAVSKANKILSDENLPTYDELVGQLDTIYSSMNTDDDGDQFICKEADIVNTTAELLDRAHAIQANTVATS